ncbi:MAG: ATP-binding protein, partial [Desulfotomaculaceae bacterium]|nr:ATP-binding protein [Desulfotomaculaceae bacterium]
SVVSDISERKRLEEEMSRLERLNLIGEMAAGNGHEIRNPMTTIRGFLQMLGEKKECINFREYYNLMIEELDRANSIISEYLSLAKNKAVSKKYHNLNHILKALHPLIQADAMRTDMYVHMVLEDIPDLLLDEKEIRQLILNMVRNGLEAMTLGEKITLKTFTEGDKVVLAVQDQGTGIEPDVLGKMGTPFFTTKDSGTGLGLAVCYSIAARQNASIRVETGPTGTTFYVDFSAS